MNAAERHPYRWATIAAIAAAVVGVAIYLAASQATFRLGFPLDDAWIHQTYARNLALRGEWAFVPGEASGGSTAPLWTILLAVGGWMRLDPRAWAYLLGTLALAGGAAVGVHLFGASSKARFGWLIGLALVFALEWHLIWAAASGMEVILLVALAVVVMRLSLPAVRRPVLTGAIVGVAMWIRPDAVTLGLIPLLAITLERGAAARARRNGLLRLAIGAGLVAAPYLLFNLGTAGTLWPSTFYAKRAEYAELRQAGYGFRLLRLALAPLTGSGILLLPGVFVAAVVALRRKHWSDLAPLVWSVVYLGIFAAWLPVAYQHGRYQIPVLPVLIVFGWQGIHAAVSSASRPAMRVLTRAWAAATVALTLAFVVLGARAYALDVAFIETEMVDTARWIAAHTDGGSRIAAHDIGALGYFGQRRVLDLAGLAQPAVIPILRDEAALAAYLDDAGADYLMTFPGWYPRLTVCGEAVYTSRGSFIGGQGDENMQVFRWRGPSVVSPEGCMLYSPWPNGADLVFDE